jgi:hypothetical protein
MQAGAAVAVNKEAGFFQPSKSRPVDCATVKSQAAYSVVSLLTIHLSLLDFDNQQFRQTDRRIYSPT